MELLKSLFSSGDFMPHGYCYLWDRALVLLHLISDVLIALSYFSIPITLVYFVRKRRDLPFHWMFLCFGTFIIACGSTHVMEIWTLWHANYWLAGIVKAITAVASVPTAILLVQLVPKALSLPSPEKLKEINQSLNYKTSELEAANRELEAFSYSVSHDLRAPLRHMDGFSRILDEEFSDELPEQAKHYIGRVRQGAIHMNLLVEDLLQLSRIGRQALRQDFVSPGAFVEDVIVDLSQETAGRKIEWKIGTLPNVRADAALLKQVMINLLSNAVKFTRATPHAVIEVGGREEGGETIVFVRDNGAGFDPRYADKLFGVFQRLHRQDEFEGTGIGLAIVQRIVHKHGGRVWAESQPGQGATFFFALPGQTRPRVPVDEPVGTNA